MSRISEIAKEMKTWWGNDGSDIEVQNVLDEIIRLDEVTDRKTEPTISKMEQVDEPQKIYCPKCGSSDYIKNLEKDFGVKDDTFKYKCINCNTYIKDETQTERSE